MLMDKLSTVLVASVTCAGTSSSAFQGRHAEPSASTRESASSTPPALNPGPADVDSDGDSIPDHIDACPAVPENFNGVSDTDGCPDRLPARVCPYSLSPQIYFTRRGRITLNSIAIRTLRELALFLEKNPENRIEIRGHASLDEARSEIVSEEISLRRAKVVKDLLVRKFGIKPYRLEILSMGSEDPFPCSSVSLEDVDERDRRVDFQLLPAHSRRYVGPLDVQ